MPERRRLQLIPVAKVKPKKQSVLAQPEGAEGPILRGESTGVEWLCGACGKVLVEGMEPGQVSGVVLRCACGVYNDGSV